MLGRIRRRRGALEVGRRVAIREALASDTDEFVALMRTSRSFHAPWSFPPRDPVTFDALLRRARRDDFSVLLVTRRSDRRIVGFFSLSQIFRGSFQNAHLGYAVGAPFAGRGYMAEGLELVLRHAFGWLGLHRVEANIQPGNGASIALVRRSGFRNEGFSPRYLKIDGQWRDHERWAILAEDFESERSGRAGPLAHRNDPDPP